jgi:TPR repeat protein
MPSLVVVLKRSVMARKRYRLRLARTAPGARNRATERFRRASEAWEAGRHRSAFRLFLLAAKAGDAGAQLNLGYFYDEGIGVHKNPTLALMWYRRAHNNGDVSASCNIGLFLKARGDLDGAARWFNRSIQRGNDDCRLHMADIYRQRGDFANAKALLAALVKSTQAAEHSRFKARQMLMSLEGRRPSRLV